MVAKLELAAFEILGFVLAFKLMTRDFSIQQKLMYSCICCFVASSYFDKTELDLGARHVTLCKFTHASSQPRWSSPRIVNHDCMMVVVLPSSVGACWMETASLYHPPSLHYSYIRVGLQLPLQSP
ncbi:hypothetical protein O6H91_09G121600 [Diphasiastrum complanatum]|uniref:Uncharacterized protein n=1 Tax=Diphasiastrum complanatum TaxID=34168 RepID=A0ACC2CU23_DIPCM|nr:hypothetical protein O6H91_09G121600 [Diphasiastrum complanatum]